MISPEQREARRNYLGSSDMAALLGFGFNEDANPSNLWLEKTGQLEPKEEVDTGVQSIGNVFEKAVIDLFEQKQKVKVERNIFLTYEMFCSNLDGCINLSTAPEVVEGKTTGKIEEWGEPWTDEIPERNILQVHEQMYVVSKVTGIECRIAWVPVLLPGYRHLEHRIYRVERNDDLMESIINAGRQFWLNHVVPKIKPEPYKPSETLLKRLKRIPNKIVDIPDELVTNWLTTNQAALDADKIAKAAKAAVIAALGDADGGRYSTGLVTYFQQSRAGYTVEPTSFPVLRNPKGKK